jgi:hypothetical protein
MLFNFLGNFKHSICAFGKLSVVMRLFLRTGASHRHKKGKTLAVLPFFSIGSKILYLALP